MSIFQYFIAMFTLIALGYFWEIEAEREIKNRKTQSRSFLKENLINEKLNEIVNKKVKLSKRRKIELLCTQAGLKIGYTEYLIISIISSLVISLGLGYLLKNPFIVIVFLGIGFFVPKQVIGIIKNKRLNILDDQVGSFLNILTKRLEAVDSFHSALKITADELKGEQPISHEVDVTLANLELTGDPVGSLEGLAERTGNEYLKRFAAYYAITLRAGNSKSKIDLLSQAYVQYEENRQLNRKNKKEVSETTRIIYVFIAAIPLIAVIQANTDPEYIPFMTETLMGRIGTLVIVLIMLIVSWVAVNKIGGPLD